MRVVSIDVETETIKPGDMIPRLVSFAWADTYDPRGRLLHHSECEGRIRWLLADPDALLCGHFMAYDMAVLMIAFGLEREVFAAYDANRIACTKIRAQLLDIRNGTFAKGRGYSLADLAKRELNIDLAKGEDTWRLRYGELRGTPIADWPQAAKDYALLDPDVTLRLWQAQEKSSPIRDEFPQARASFWLHLCATRGLRVDEAARDRLIASLQAEEAALLTQLTGAGFIRAKGVRDTKAVKARMLAAGSKRVTAKGNIKIDAESCEATGDPDLVAYGRLGEVRSALSGSCRLLSQNPVHTRYDLAITGRTTSGGKEGKQSIGNLQNLPRTGGVRECFIPRPGFVFANADYDGLELRTMAQACLELVGYSTLADELNAGRDPHTEMAAAIGMPGKDGRQTAKGLNFGLPGGMGRVRLRAHLKTYGVDVSEDRAAELAQLWKDARPEFSDEGGYFDQCGQRCRGSWSPEGGFNPIAELVHIGSGRVRRGSPEIPFTEYANGIFQGLGSDAAKRAGWLITRACWAQPESPLYGSRIVLFAHDELLIEVPETKASAAAQELGRLMRAGADELLPDVPTKTTPLLTMCYSKEAKPVYATGPDGEEILVPWRQPTGDRPGSDDGLGPVPERDADDVRTDTGRGRSDRTDYELQPGCNRVAEDAPEAPPAPGPDHASSNSRPDCGPVPSDEASSARGVEGSTAQGRVLAPCPEPAQPGGDGVDGQGGPQHSGRDRDRALGRGAVLEALLCAAPGCDLGIFAHLDFSDTELSDVARCVRRVLRALHDNDSGSAKQVSKGVAKT